MLPELERLIDLVLADGVLSDKERQVLYRKAQELGVDKDEFEMVLECKLRSSQQPSAPPNDSHRSTMNNEQRRFYKRILVGFAALLGLTIITDSVILGLLTGVSILVMIGLGISLVRDNWRTGLPFLGFTIALIGTTFFVASLAKAKSSSPPSNYSPRKAYDRQETSSYICPHCNGMGIRYHGFNS